MSGQSPWLHRSNVRYGGWDTRWWQLNREYQRIAWAYEDLGLDLLAPFGCASAADLNGWYHSGWIGEPDLEPGYPTKTSIARFYVLYSEYPPELPGDDAIEARALFVAHIGERIRSVMYAIATMGEQLNFYNAHTGGKGGRLQRV